MANNFKGTEKTKLNGLYATLSEGSEKITIMFITEDGTGSGVLNIYLKAFNEVTKKYVDDAETKEKATELLKELGTSLETVIDDAPTLTGEFYFDGERVSLNPIRGFIKYDRVTTRDGKHLTRNFEDVKLTMASDYKGLRFDIGFNYDSVENGEEVVKTYRVSQFSIPNPDPDKDDLVISPKYQSKKMNSMWEQIKLFRENKSSLSEKAIEQIEKLYEKDIVIERDKKSEEFEDKFGINLNDWVANPDLYTVDAEVYAKSLDTNDGAVYFLVAEIKNVTKNEAK